MLEASHPYSPDALEHGVHAYRLEHRAQGTRSGTALAIEVLFTNLCVLALLAFFFHRLSAPRWIDWLALPPAVLVSNGIEYLTHRFVMHRKRRFLGFAFTRHARWHHGFYTEHSMSYDTFGDCHLVFFPILLQLGFLALVILPISWVASVALGSNAAAVLGIGLILYFLNYEWFHFLYHCKPGNPLLRLRLIRAMKLHHSAHHQQTEMARVNFNITYPFCDWLFDTYVTGPKRGAR